MAEKNLGRVIIAETGKLRGIFSERDYVRKVVQEDILPKEMKVSELMTTEEINTLADTYSGMADTYIGRFEKWLCHNTIPEYKLHQDEVNASKTITNRSGWFFGAPSNRVQARIFNEGDDDWSEYSYKNR